MGKGGIDAFVQRLGARRKRRPALLRALHLPRDVAADQITQRVNGFVGNAVVHAGAPSFAGDHALLGEQREVARHVGGGEATVLGNFAHIALARAQQVQDLQPGGFRQGLKVGRNLQQSVWRQVFHMRAIGNG